MISSSDGYKHQQIPRSQITPEYLALIRAIRKKRKEEKERNTIPIPFQKRKILYVPDDLQQKSGIKFRLMTYNVLSQHMIRRENFPYSNESIKWKYRSQMYMNEFKYYSPDILCMQEVDAVHWDNFWVPQFDKLGMSGVLYSYPKKVHGVAVVWQKSLFKEDTLHQENIILDNYSIVNEIGPRTKTKSVALIASLEINPKLTRDGRIGIIIVTTHLFWHPFGTFERVRQLYIILDQIKKFERNLPKEVHWLTFLAGDFNSQPCDAPYISITSKPVKFKGDVLTNLKSSIAYRYSAKRNEGENYLSSEEETELEGEPTNQPTDPRPKKFQISALQLKMIQKLQTLHNRMDLKAYSLYGTTYHKLDPTNHNEATGLEPECSHSSLYWSGLLDYIFYIGKWNSAKPTDGELRENNELEKQFTTLGLLQLPSDNSELQFRGPEDGKYPSDHLSMMAELYIYT